MEKKKPRILIIEDDEYSREAIEHLLNTKGCEIISAAGGRRGFGLARGWRRCRPLRQLSVEPQGVSRGTKSP
jgi:CheY-like chemotaxis protein